MCNFYISFRMAVILVCVFKPMFKWLFLTVISTLLLQILHTLCIPLSAWRLTLRPFIVPFACFNVYIFCLSLQNPDFRHFLLSKDVLSEAQSAGDLIDTQKCHLLFAFIC